jgi:hypothetical protein
LVGRTRTIAAPQRLQWLRQTPSIRRAFDTERRWPRTLQTMCAINARLHSRIVPSK